MHLSRRTVALAVATMLGLALAGPAANVARGSTPRPNRVAAPARIKPVARIKTATHVETAAQVKAAARTMRADDRTLPDRKADTLTRQFTLKQAPQQGSAEPALTTAEKALQADVARGLVPAPNRPAVADTGPQTFNVDSAGDQPDASVGDGVCAVDQSVGGGCTLRAAIQEANFTTDKDTITFSVPKIAPTSSLPPITEPVIIDGGTASATELTGSADPGEPFGGLILQGSGSTVENLTINDFAAIGLLLAGNGSNTVRGCHIGTDPSGETAAPNGGFTNNSAGIEIEDANSLIGGPDPSDRNVISGNNGFGVYIGSDADNTHVEGNTIGLDATGTSSLPNSIGVLVTYFNAIQFGPTTAAKNVVIGGPDPADGNLISGNSAPNAAASAARNYIGLDVLDNGTTVTNNTIGLNTDGDAVGNGIGVWLSNVANAVLGTAGAGNVIAASVTDGVRLDGPLDTGDTIQANDIGTDADGDPGLGNGAGGVDFYYSHSETGNEAPSDVTIGGSTASVRNVISGNGGAGIHIDGAGGNLITGNIIGADPSGTKPLHNRDDAIQIASSPDNTIGGSDVAQRNIIAGDKNGVLIDGAPSTGNTVEGNLIGVDQAGDKLGIGSNGISFTNQASGNVIGYDAGVTPVIVCAGTGPCNPTGVACDTISASCNTISDAKDDGVALDGTENHDPIRGNSIFGNAKLPIAFVDDAADAAEPLANDEHDADAGANGAINFPTEVMSTVQAANPQVPGAGDTVVTGTLSPAPATETSETVDVYGLTAPDDSSDPQPADQVDSWGEARAWIGNATVQPDGTFYLPVSADDASKYVSYSATATDADGNTSEVSPICMPLAGQTSDDADGDGICDEWETKGVDFDGNGTRDLDLAAYGASPSQRDLFAEVDYFPGMEPQRQALVDVRQAFEDSPVSAPNDPSHKGIDLHFGATTDHSQLTDEEISPSSSQEPMTQRGLIKLRDGSPAEDCDGHFGSEADRRSPDCWQILGAKRLIWRYIVFADNSVDGYSTGGAGDIAGRTVVMTLGGWMATAPTPLAPHIPRIIASAGGYPEECDSYDTCLMQTQSGTLMHEFGHTLGLGHGGADGVNDKPNYLSVMNYNLMGYDVVPNRPLDYSSAALPTLDENALVETEPIAGDVPAQKIGDWTTTAYQARKRDDHGNIIPDSCTIITASISKPIDWNNNERIDSAPVAETPAGDGSTCSDIIPTGDDAQLTGFDDWDNLQYTPVPVGTNAWAWPGGVNASGARTAKTSGSTPLEPGLDPYQLALRADFDHDGISNGKDDCPSVSNASQKQSSVKGIGQACIGLIKERDLSVTMKITGKAKRGKTLHVKVSVRDSYPLAATGDVVSFKIPHGLKLKSAKASTGKYAKSSGKWTIRKIGADKTVTLTLVVKVTGKLPTTVTAELIKAGQKDPNSTPNNHKLYEDDEARHVIG
jgi:CSLREA domain-containing protein